MFQKRRRGSAAPAQFIGTIISIISFVVVFFTILHLITHGDIVDWLQWLLNYIVIFDVVIQFPFGITIFVFFTAGGIGVTAKGGR